MPLTSRNEWNTLTLEDIESEIESRHELRGQMVGTLYPEILLQEIHDLRLLEKDLHDREQIRQRFDDANILKR